MAAIDDVVKRIIDENKRSFTVNDVADHDTDIFYSLYAAPLRTLHERGVVEDIAELRNHRNDVVRVDIVGGINFEPE